MLWDLYRNFVEKSWPKTPITLSPANVSGNRLKSIVRGYGKIDRIHGTNRNGDSSSIHSYNMVKIIKDWHSIV